MNRQERISYLTRINRGRTERPEFLRRLSAALETEIYESKLIDLESTDEFLQCMGKGYAAAKGNKEPGFARYFSRDEQQSLFALVSCLRDKLIDRPAIIYFSQSEICGALAIDASLALAYAASLITVDGNGLSMIAENRDDGLMLDFNPDDHKDCYELIVWGATWPVLLLACV